MRTCEAVVLSGRVLRPVTVLVSVLVRVERVAVVWVEREERNTLSFKLLLTLLLVGEDNLTLLLLFELLLVVLSLPLSMPPIKFHAPE